MLTIFTYEEDEFLEMRGNTEPGLLQGIMMLSLWWGHLSVFHWHIFILFFNHLNSWQIPTTLLISGQAAQDAEIISHAFCDVSRNPCSLYLLVHFWTNVPPTMIKGLFNIPLDILILILFNSLILSFKHFMADIMGQTVHQAMSDSITDTAECMQQAQHVSWESISGAKQRKTNIKENLISRH